jgi:hypothetical protein
MTRIPRQNDGLAPALLTPAVALVDDTQSEAHAIGTALLLEAVVATEGALAWWVWGDFVVCPRWRMVVEVTLN